MSKDELEKEIKRVRAIYFNTRYYLESLENEYLESIGFSIESTDDVFDTCIYTLGNQVFFDTDHALEYAEEEGLIRG